jgi:dipeptidyl aminopeptidase/acylaminoacyl peptidase
MPETFIVKAEDGVTDIYGNMWKPFNMDPHKKYPIIAHVYPGPQTESVTDNFTAAASEQQLAQLGFIVIQIGNRGGSPRRSKNYHNYGYGNLRDYGLADKKVGIEQLANRHSFIDIDHVGIYGHSGGGFMTAAALLLPPYNDFFTAGVASAGNHDNNIYNAPWSEMRHGMEQVETENDDGETEIDFTIDVPDNAELAANLKGHLLLTHGDMDNNVHPGGTIRLINALIENNKKFDFMIFPGKAHGFGDMQGYFNRMIWDHFTKYLIGESRDDMVDMFPDSDKK